METFISKADAIASLGEEPEVWLDDDGYEHGLAHQWQYDISAIKAIPDKTVLDILSALDWEGQLFYDQEGNYHYQEVITKEALEKILEKRNVYSN